MAKVGRLLTDPKAGAYCQITLDSGEKIMVDHAGSGFDDGTVTIEAFEATALGVFVAHVKSCKSVAEVKTSCAALMSIR